MNAWSGLYLIGCGLWITLRLLVGGLAIGLLLGTVLAIFRRHRLGKFFIPQYISLVRGTPLLLQLSLIYFALPGFIGVKLDVVTAGIFAFGLNSSAYVAEILRAGIGAVPRGQFEAAKTLGISPFHTWKDILLPQIFRNILPALVGEVIALLKETALIATIGGADIMRRSQMIAAEHFTYFTPLCIAGLYYYLLVIFIEFLGKKMERKLAHAAH